MCETQTEKEWLGRLRSFLEQSSKFRFKLACLLKHTLKGDWGAIFSNMGVGCGRNLSSRAQWWVGLGSKQTWQEAKPSDFGSLKSILWLYWDMVCTGPCGLDSKKGVTLGLWKPLEMQNLLASSKGFILNLCDIVVDCQRRNHSCYRGDQSCLHVPSSHRWLLSKGYMSSSNLYRGRGQVQNRKKSTRTLCWVWLRLGVKSLELLR